MQSCWTLADERTREREVGDAREARRELRATQATIVTWQEDEDVGGGVRCIPLWQWLLRLPSA